jgi:hypothetical protein
MNQANKSNKIERRLRFVNTRRAAVHSSALFGSAPELDFFYHYAHAREGC